MNYSWISIDCEGYALIMPEIDCVVWVARIVKNKGLLQKVSYRVADGRFVCSGACAWSCPIEDKDPEPFAAVFSNRTIICDKIVR